MDFWVGEWRLAWEGGEGSNSITKTLGGCVVEENFDGRPGTTLIGNSVSTYHRPLGKWRQTWVDNSGGYFDLTGGPEGDKFIFDLVHLTDETPYLRMVFDNIGENSLEWTWQRSGDAGATWETRWHIHYTRK